MTETMQPWTPQSDRDALLPWLKVGRHGRGVRAGYPVSVADPYVDVFWLPVVGPSVVALLRVGWRLVDRGVDVVETQYLAGRLGVSRVLAKNAPLARTLYRARDFRLIAWDDRGGVVGFPAAVRLVSTGQLDRVEQHCRGTIDDHTAYVQLRGWV